MKGKKMNKTVKLILNCSLAVILCVSVIVGNVIAYTFENQINSLLAPAIIDEDTLRASSESGQKLSQRIVEEGATLLRNENDTLPLSKKDDKKVNIFGWRSIDWIYGSEGSNASGGVRPEDGDISKNVDLYKALANAGISCNEKLRTAYTNFRKPDQQSANLKGTHINNLTPLCEPSINDRYYFSSLFFC